MKSPPHGWQYAFFRAWKAREHGRAEYDVAPRVWTAAGLARVGDREAAERAMLKNCEPALTGATWTDRHVYLVLAVGELGPEAVGRLLYLAELYRRDPDYARHHAKRLHLVMLVRSAADELIDFARRRRIRVAVAGANTA